MLSHTVLIPNTEDAVNLRQVTACRPISRTNVDYTILMKGLAGRLQSVIAERVVPHKTFGIKGRTIFTNIHKARSVLECCDAMRTHVTMLQVDLEKALDRVPHDLLLSILDFVDVGAVEHEGVRMAYNGCSTRLIKQVGWKAYKSKSIRPPSVSFFPLFFFVFK